MKYLNKTLLALLATSIFSLGAQAGVMDSPFDQRAYIGIKAGQFTLDDNSFEDPIAYGVFAGYRVDPNFAFEAEYIGSGEADINIRNGSGKVDVNTYGAYATYRYYFPSSGLYTKGKLGFATTETDVVISGNRNNDTVEVYGSDRQTSVAGGLGIGYAINDFISLEGEYDIADADIDLMTFGAKIEY